MSAAAPPLPGVLEEFAAAAGRAAACAVALAHGGDDGWSVPRDLRGPAGRALAELTGETAARALALAFGGQDVSVPLARRALVVHLSEAGMTTTAIARRLGVTRRTARRYRRDAALAAEGWRARQDSNL